jgi:outer membrane protein assembly factor BamB
MTVKTSQSDESAQLRQVVQAIAVIGLIFTLVFLGLMIVNGYRQYVSAPRMDANLDILKEQLLQQPDNETLINMIREQDRSVRADKLRQLDFAGVGSLMLLLSAAVAIGALKWLSWLKGIAPLPCLDNEEPYQRRRLSASRIALVVLAVLLASTALLFGQRVQSGWLALATTGSPGKADYASPDELAENWHRFRGFAGAGVVSQKDIPTKWDGASGSGILWKTAIPLQGHNSPVIWKDRIFLAGASYEKREVYCFDASSGSILWTGNVPAIPGVVPDVMADTGFAASTVATDGARVYAIFPTGDLAAFDFNGRLLWHKSLGTPNNLYGHATSLEVWQDRVFVQYDYAFVEDNKSRLYAIDGPTGNIVWEAKRPVANGWATPIIARADKEYQLITVGDPWIIAYDPEDGKEIWKVKFAGGNVAASPVLADDLVIAVAPNKETVAIRSGGAGDVTGTHVAWYNEDIAPEIVSPVADDRRVFLMDTYGTLYTLNPADGKLLYKHDFGENVKASPTLVAGRLYVQALSGTMYIGTPGEKGFTLETKNSLGEECNASPAFMAGRIYIRGTNYLYCIGK